MLLFLQALVLDTWGGYHVGESRWYEFLEDGGLPYYVLDTVVYYGSWDGSGSKCSFFPSIEKADLMMVDTAHSLTEIQVAYFDGTYMVDFGHALLTPYFLYATIRTLKIPFVVGDTWPAVDTCQAALRERIPLGIDEDMDGIVDSVYFDTSYATLFYYDGNEARVRVSPLNVIMAYTASAPYGDTAIACCGEYVMKYYITFHYRYNVGLIYMNIDSLLTYRRHLIIDTAETPWDTTVLEYSPMNYYDFQTMEYISTSIRENRMEYNDLFRLRGGVLRSLSDLSIFTPDGRLVARLWRGQSVHLKPGLYFIRAMKGVAKVMVK
ncbi:MAG: hypothetical protein GXO39_04185 [Thermotogae bacterium]|nr:hypothetical protein [Thermotogota bacterium]